MWADDEIATREREKWVNETGRKNARMDGGGWKDTVTDLPRVTIFRVHLAEEKEEEARRRRRKWERGVATTDRNVNTRQRLDEKGTKGNSSKGTRKKKKKKKDLEPEMRDTSSCRVLFPLSSFPTYN